VRRGAGCRVKVRPRGSANPWDGQSPELAVAESGGRFAPPADLCILVHMVQVVQSDLFASWLQGLRDLQARARIAARIERLRLSDHFGDTKAVGEGVSEMRIDHGPGYRLYFARRGEQVVILLCGGDKGSQNRDIRTAIRMAEELR
jgi:putative addiction module killer protein